EAVIPQILRGQGRVVEEAVTAIERVPRVMPRWPAQGVGALLALGDPGGGRQRAVGGGERGLPGALDDRRAGVEAVVAHLPVDAGGDVILAQAPGGEAARQ